MSDAIPVVSAVLISWNRADDLKRAIESLRRQAYLNLEIIIIDNGSTDESLLWLRQQPDIQLIENSTNVGACRARNQGIQRANAEYVLFMDSDAVLVTPGAIERQVQTLQADAKLAGAGGIIYGDEAMEDIWCVSPTTDWEGNYDPAASVQMTNDPHILSTCFSLFRLDAVREAGGFDEFYFYLFEDGDLCLQLRKRGWRLMIDSEVKIIHHYSKQGRTERGQIAYHYYHERIRMYYVLKNYGLGRFLASWRHKIGETFSFKSRFAYMPFWRYVDLYYLRMAAMLLRYPYIVAQRRRTWV
ncbi:MAG: glycosyltransferase family 2 protein [Candidatus Hinthialibacter antarcticus]|nr:glycosyltransferase family 2 protein [Candidatus Hinthialibacter antarcticus]